MVELDKDTTVSLDRPKGTGLAMSFSLSYLETKADLFSSRLHWDGSESSLAIFGVETTEDG